MLLFFYFTVASAVSWEGAFTNGYKRRLINHSHNDYTKAFFPNFSYSWHKKYRLCFLLLLSLISNKLLNDILFLLFFSFSELIQCVIGIDLHFLSIVDRHDLFNKNLVIHWKDVFIVTFIVHLIIIEYTSLHTLFE